MRLQLIDRTANSMTGDSLFDMGHAYAMHPWQMRETVVTISRLQWFLLAMKSKGRIGSHAQNC
jgi:hypothetical protein